MDIGPEKQPFVVEPLEDPVPGREREVVPEPERETVPERVPELVPV